MSAGGQDMPGGINRAEFQRMKARIKKLYAERDPMEQDRQGNHFSKHMHAMTAEDLHSKAAIAEELAHRDIEIERLQTKENGQEVYVCELEARVEHLEAVVDAADELGPFPTYRIKNGNQVEMVGLAMLQKALAKLKEST